MKKVEVTAIKYEAKDGLVFDNEIDCQIYELEEENARLKEENAKLKEENEKLKKDYKELRYLYQDDHDPRARPYY